MPGGAEDPDRNRCQQSQVAGQDRGGLLGAARARSLEELLARYRTPALLLQGKRDASRSVADFAARCAGEDVELHFFADGDHRLTDRKDRLWVLMREFLRGRRLI